MPDKRLRRFIFLFGALCAVLVGGIALLLLTPGDSAPQSVTFAVNPAIGNSATPTAASRATASIIPPLTAAATPLPTANASSSARLLFVGDVMLGRHVTPIRRAQGNGYPLAPVAPLIRSADLAFCNLESPLTNQTYFRGGYNLRAEPDAVESLALAGFDWVSVANNHSGDHGRAGMVDTLNALRSKNIAWAGGGETEAIARRPALKTINGLRLALLAYDGTRATIEAAGNQAGSQWLDVNRASADIKRARADGADIVIVSIHWGVEYSALPTASQTQIARQLALAGADLLIGHHPHVVEPLEWIARPDGRTSVVAYSLGNFLFDQMFSAPVMEGAIAQVVVDKKGVAALNLLPTRHVGDKIRIQSPAASAAEMQRLLPSGALPAAWQRNATVDAEGRTWWRRPNP